MEGLKLRPTNPKTAAVQHQTEVSTPASVCVSRTRVSFNKRQVLHSPFFFLAPQPTQVVLVLQGNFELSESEACGVAPFRADRFLASDLSHPRCTCKRGNRVLLYFASSFRLCRLPLSHLSACHSLHSLAERHLYRRATPSSMETSPSSPNRPPDLYPLAANTTNSRTVRKGHFTSP